MLNRRPLLFASTAVAAWTFSSTATLQAQPNLKPFAARFLPDNKRVMVAGEDGALALLNVPELTLVRHYSGDPGKLRTIAVSPDGKWVAAHYDKGKLWIFDVETGEAKQQIANPDLKPGPMMFSAQGRLLLLSNTNVLMQFDPMTGAAVAAPMRINGKMPAFSADGKLLAVVDGNLMVYVHDIAEGKSLGNVYVRMSPAMKQFERGWLAEPVFLGFRSDGRVQLGVFFKQSGPPAAYGAPPGSNTQSSTDGRLATFKGTDQGTLEVTTKSLTPLSVSTHLYPDGKIFLVSYGGMALWEADGPDVNAAWDAADPGKTRLLDGADLSADRAWVVGVSKRSGEVEIWDTRALEKKEKKMFGRVILSWQQPKLVTMAKMP